LYIKYQEIIEKKGTDKSKSGEVAKIYNIFKLSNRKKKRNYLLDDPSTKPGRLQFVRRIKISIQT